MANTLTRINTNFNTAPYWDDFNPDKNFYRVVSKPALAIQAREANQTQAILQNQISEFADNIFKSGSVVTGGQFILDNEYGYVKLNDLNIDANAVVVSDFLNKEIVGLTTGVRARVYFVEFGTQEVTNKKTLIFKYTSTGTNNTTSTFLPGEEIRTTDNFKATAFATDSVGKSLVFTVEEGTFYLRGFFVKVPKQSIIVGKYINTPTALVGLTILEEIIDFNEDPSLLDPANGSTNFSAPGADRFKITGTLTRFVTGETVSDDFIQLIDIRDGIIQESYEKPQYSVIRDELARRTSDESGDYYVKGLNVRLREHLNTEVNQGLYLAADGGNNSLLAIGVEPGKAYVKGYDIEKLVTRYVNTLKGLESRNLEQAQVTANYGNYITVNEYVGYFPLNGTKISIRNATQTRLTQKLGSSGAVSGTEIGTARVKAVDHISGTAGTPSAVYRIYVYDVNMVTGDFASARSVYIDNASGADGYADIFLYSGSAYLEETTFNGGIYEIGNNSIKDLRDESSQVDTTFTFIKNFDIITMSGGIFTVNTGNAAEIFPYGVGALNSTQRSDFIFIPNATTDTGNLTGTVGYTVGAATVTGVGTAFTTQLAVGDFIVIAGSSNNPHRIVTITSPTALTVAANITGTTGTGNVFQKRLLVGQPIDFTTLGTTGARSITVNSSTSATFDIEDNISVAGTLITKLNRTDALEGRKLLRPDRYIHINVGANITGPINLGIADAYRIKEVRRKSGSDFASLSEGTVITSSCVLDNGQRDDFYDIAKLRLLTSLTTNDRLLVKLDYFEPDYSQGIGYFTVDSYPVDDTIVSNTTIRTELIPIHISPITNKRYDLRNCIDIRPVKTNTATASTTLPSVQTEASLASDTFVGISGQLYTTYPNENFIFDYSYYMGRYDLVVMNGDGIVKVIRGAPDSNPITPDLPGDSMQLARIFIAPYPSLASTYASSINRNDLACKIDRSAYKRYTMRDIGVLEKRVENLEYYTALNLLEKNALDLIIPDEGGLDRFKNGIFVDPFTSHILGDQRNVDYRIGIDPSRGELRPTFTKEITEYDIGTLNNTVQIGNSIVLAHQELVYAEQKFATNTRNTAGFFYRYKGNLTLDPASDYWTDTETIPELQVTTGATAESYQALVNAQGTVWNDWQTTWSGEQQTGNTVTTTTQQARTGTRLQVQTTTQTQNIGTRVVDVSIAQFMRARTIRVFVRGLKPNTKMFAFFDGENVTSYITPTNSSYAPTGAMGADLIVDNSGNAYGLFNLPNNNALRFRVGSKVFRLTNSFNNGDDAICSAEFTYAAEGLVQKKQDTLLTTITPQFSSQGVSETQNITTSVNVPAPTSNPAPAPAEDPNFIIEDGVVVASLVNGQWFGGDSRTPGWAINWDPIAQTFFVDTNGVGSAVFMKSIGLYFAQKDSTLGVTVQIRTVNSAGYIEGTVVPNSEFYIPSASISTSTDGTVETKVSFPSLVVLSNKCEYAIVILPEQNNPNTVVWTSRLGETDLITGQSVTSQPFSGNFFVSSNNRTWSPIQDEDLKFKIYRADFAPGSSGTLTMYNRPKEFIYLDSTETVGVWDVIGERVYGENRLTLTSITGGTIVVGEKVQGNTSGAIGTITNINGSVYRVKGTGLTSFVNNEAVTILSSIDVDTGKDAVLVSQTIPTGILEKYKVIDSVDTYAVLTSSTGNFVVDEFIYSEINEYIAKIDSFDKLYYSLIDFEPSILDFIETQSLFDAKSTSLTNIIDSSGRSVSVSDNTNFRTQRIINSRVLENSLMSGNRSLTHIGTLATSSRYVSPILNIDRTYTILIDNELNNDTTGETGKSGGSALNRYISQKVTLDQDQDAEDLRVYLTGYRPPNSDIKMYAKIIHAEDSDTFENKNWFELSTSASNPVSSIDNENDFKEIQFNIPDAMKTGSNGEVQYVKGSVTFTGYKYFQLKVILIGTNPGVPPRGTDLRAIALQL